MSNKSIVFYRAVLYDLLIVLIITALSALVFHYFDMYDRLRLFLIRYEAFEIDEYFLGFLCLALALCWFSYRRLRTAYNEIMLRRAADESLKRKDKILETVSYAAERLLLEQSWESGIKEIFAKLGAAAHVSRVYLFENSVNEDGAGKAFERFEWVAPGIKPRTENLKELLLSTSSRQKWDADLTEGKVVFSRTDELTDDERKILAENEIKSVLFAPVFCGGSLWGALGFDDCEDYREWDEAEIDALKTAASSLGAAIYKEKSTNALRDREAAYRQLVEYAPAGLFELDLRDFSFLSVNEVLCEYTGYSKEELLQMKASQLFVGEGKERFLHTVSRAGLTQADEEDLVCQMIKADGGKIWAMLAVNLVYENGEPSRARVVAQDITQRKAVEEALQENEKKFKILFEHIPALSFVLDSEHRRIAVNDVLGERRDKQIGVPTLSIEGVRESTKIFWHEVEEQVLRSGEPTWYTELVPPKYPGGKSYFYETRLQPIAGPTGDVSMVVGISQDITDQRHAEEALRASEARYRFLVQNAHDIIYETDTNGRFVYMNPAGLEMTGYSMDEMIGKSFQNLIRHDYLKDAVRFYRQQYDQRSPGSYYEFPMVSKRGEEVWLGQQVQLIVKDDVISGFHAFARDITDRKKAEEALLNSEKRYRLLAENMSDVLYTVGLDMKLSYVTPSVTRFMGYTSDELMAMDMKDYVTSESLEVIRAAYVEYTERESRGANDPRGSITLELQFVRKNGELLWAEITTSFLRDENGAVIGVLGLARDLTERKRAREELKKAHEELEQRVKERTAELTAANQELQVEIAERTRAETRLTETSTRLQALINTIPDIVYFKDSQGRNIIVNKAFEELVGLSQAEIKGKTDDQIAPPALAKAWKASDRKTLISGRVSRFEEKTLTKDGAPVYLETVKAPFYDGRVIGLVAVSRDITDRKHQEEALRESEERYRQLVEHAPVGIFEIDLNTWRVTGANDAIHEVVGYTKEEFMEAHSADSHLAGIKRKFNERISFLIANKAKSDTFECEARKKSGAEICCLANIRIKYDEEKPVKAAAVVHDITARKKAEELVRESEARYRSLIEHMPIACFTYDERGTILSWNQQAEKIYGYSKEEAIGNRCDDLIVLLEGKDTCDSIRKRVFDGEYIVGWEWRDRNKRGEPGWRVGNSFPLLKANGEVECGVNLNIDVTTQKLAEAERALLVAAIEQASELVVVTDTEGAIQYVNPSFENVTGYSKDEALGKNPRILKSGKHEPAHYERLWETISSGEIWKGRFINKKKDGSLYEERATITPIRNQFGEIVNYVAVKRDSTQEARLEEQLRQSQKSQAIGTLAGGIAHDFNNILSAIIGYTELSITDLPQNSYIADNLEEVLKAGKRAKDLVSQILTYTRHTEHEKAPVQLSAIIKEAIKLIRPSLPATIEVRQDIRSEGVVIADSTQIHQLIMNLCTNAYQSMKTTGGILEVLLEEIKLDDVMAEQFPGLATGPYLRLTVRDTGIGMDLKTKERIFDPYFTTKKKGEGTGLGLAVAQGIVRGHGGLITVASEAGKGSEFQVFLPTIQRMVEFEEEIYSPTPGGSEQILFVDDEEQLTQMARQMLERLGYEVTATSSSLEAWRLFQENPDSFDMVITDMTMPSMTGVDLAKRMMSVRPDIPIMLCTGYSDLISKSQAEALGIKAYLLKPLSRSDLSRAIREVLDREALSEENL